MSNSRAPARHCRPCARLVARHRREMIGFQPRFGRNLATVWLKLKFGWIAVGVRLNCGRNSVELRSQSRPLSHWILVIIRSQFNHDPTWLKVRLDRDRNSARFWSQSSWNLAMIGLDFDFDWIVVGIWLNRDRDIGMRRCHDFARNLIVIGSRRCPWVHELGYSAHDGRRRCRGDEMLQWSASTIMQILIARHKNFQY